MNLIRTAVLVGIVAAGVAIAQSGPASGNDTDHSGMTAGKPANMDKMDGGTKTSSPHSKKQSKPTTGTPGTDTSSNGNAK